MEARPAANPNATPAPPLNLPPELAGQTQYQILRELGHGGMGVVYLATNKLLGRIEVLKVVNKALLSRPGAVERFLQEIRAAARLNHPNVVAAYNALQLGECLVFAMEYVEGEDLARLVQTRGRLPVAHACFYVQQAALGLQHAFEKGMVHRDIKPQNLILARAGKKHVVKVLDFGLAKATRDKSVDHALTGAGKMLGTPDFVAPEQTVDAATVDIRADIYSLGCTLYYLLSGGPPFVAENLYAVLHAHHSVEAKPLNQVRPEVPAELAVVVARMMAKDPAQRYQKPVEVAQALTPFIKPGAKAAKPKAGAPAGPEGIQWETLSGHSTASVDTQQGFAVGKAAPDVAPSASRAKGWLAAGIVAGVILLGLVGLWAGGVLRVKTPDGTLVLENLPEGAEVVVDGRTVTLKPGGGTSFEVSVAAGKEHQVQVKKDGFKVFGESVAIDAGGSRAIRVHLEPLAVAQAPSSPGNTTPTLGPAQPGPGMPPGKTTPPTEPTKVGPGGPSGKDTSATEPAKPGAGMPPGMPATPSTAAADPAKEPPPMKPPAEVAKPVDPPKDPAVSELAKARDTFEATIKKLDKNLPATLDREIDALAKATISAEDRLKLIDIFKAEKAAFEKDGTIPWSPASRPVALEYLQARRLAERQLQLAYEKALDRALKARDDKLAEELRAEEKRVLAPKLVGTWDCTGTNGKGRFTHRLYSNGKLTANPDSQDTWDLVGSNRLKLVLFRPDGPQGKWIDTCIIDPEGKSYTGRNQGGFTYQAKLVR